jgi:hypothetical protein
VDPAHTILFIFYDYGFSLLVFLRCVDRQALCGIRNLPDTSCSLGAIGIQQEIRSNLGLSFFK